MDLRVEGRVAAPAVAIAGTWDPMDGGQVKLLEALCETARARELAAVAVVFDPPPQSFVAGAPRWPVYHDVDTRRELLESAAVDAIAWMRFTSADLGRTADEFFDVLSRQVELAEFWLKHRQTLGSGSTGGVWSIKDACSRRGMRLKFLPASPDAAIGAAARKHLAAGAPREACRLVGRPPTLHRPAAETLRLAWPAGRYDVVALSSPLSPPDVSCLRLDLVSDEDGMSRFEWPDPTIEYLSFVAGPADELSTARDDWDGGREAS